MSALGQKYALLLAEMVGHAFGEIGVDESEAKKAVEKEYLKLKNWTPRELEGLIDNSSVFRKWCVHYGEQLAATGKEG